MPSITKKSNAAPAASSKLPPGVKRHRFTRIQDFGDVPKTGIDRGNSLQFTLDQVPGHAEIQALYDAYSIDMVEVTFVWRAAFSGMPPGQALMPVMIAAIDYDDATPPVTFADVGEYASARLLPFNQAETHHKITIKPRTAVATFRGVTTGYTWGAESACIDAAAADVPHYGLKYFTNGLNTVANPDGAIRIYLKYHFSGYAAR